MEVLYHQILKLDARRTPGYWGCHHGSDSICQCRAVVGEDGPMGAIATIETSDGLKISEGGNDSPPLDQSKANGQLIALLPEIIELLKKQHDIIEGFNEKICLHNQRK